MMFVPEGHLFEQDRLRIRLCAVGVDSIPGGGGRALFEVFSTGHEDQPPVLTITVEASAFRAAAAGGIPSPTTSDVRRRGRPETGLRPDAGSPAGECSWRWP